MELAQEILVRDGARQLDDLLVGVDRTEALEEGIGHFFRSSRDAIRVFECDALTLVVVRTLRVAVNVVELLVADTIVSADGRVEVTSEWAAVERRNADTDECLLVEADASSLCERSCELFHRTKDGQVVGVELRIVQHDSIPLDIGVVIPMRLLRCVFSLQRRQPRHLSLLVGHSRCICRHPSQQPERSDCTCLHERAQERGNGTT
jgi:hypothetical protein